MCIALRRNRIPMVANAAPPITRGVYVRLGDALRARGLERVCRDVDGGRAAEGRRAPRRGEPFADRVDEDLEMVELRRAELLRPRADDDRADDVAVHGDRRDRGAAATGEPLDEHRLVPV